MSSLFSAMTVAVGGLAAQSSAIGNISDNLANTETTGYKGISTKFQSLVTQSNATTNDPGGVLATPYYTNSVEGNLVTDSSATSLAISGSGYFAVRAAVVSADGTTSFGDTNYYTRAGDFVLNSSGYLVNNSGYYLCGWSVSSDGEVDTSAANPIQLSELLDNPVATNTVTYSANLPAGVTSTLASTYTSAASTIKIYDSLGAQHNLSFTWTKATSNSQTAASATIGTSALSVSSTTSGTFGNGVSVTIANGTTAGTYKVTVSATGETDEVYDNISGTGNTLWQNIASAVNAGSKLVTMSAGTSTETPTLGTTALTGGAGSEMNWTASTTIGTGITIAANSTGTAGNSITTTIADGAGTNKVVTVSNGTTSETYTIDTATYSGAAFWTELAHEIDTTSTIATAYTAGGSDTPTNGTYTLSGGEAELDSTNVWELTVTVAGGGGTDAAGNALDYTATIPFVFNSTTTPSVTAGTLQEIIASGGTDSSGTYSVTTIGSAEVTLPLDFSGSGSTGTQNVTVDFGTFNSSTNGVTQFADSSVTVSSFDQDGIPRGSFQDLTIDESGFVTLNYDNGTSRIISQIPVVQFFAEQSLQRLSGGVYEQTLSSGTARYSAAGENGSGTIVSNALEGSNVDIATEFTKMIQAQRVYSANARVISTTDTMLSDVINISR